jgi:hypothetical protein
MNESLRSVGQADHLPVPRRSVSGALQIEQSVAGIIEVEIGETQAADEERRLGQILIGAWLTFRHGLFDFIHFWEDLLGWFFGTDILIFSYAGHLREQFSYPIKCNTTLL